MEWTFYWRQIQDTTDLSYGDGRIGGEDIGKVIPDRLKLFTVTTPRSVEVDKVLSC